MEDATLFNINEADSEYAAYQAILPYLMDTIEDNYAPIKGEKPEDGLYYKKITSYSSIYYYSSLLFRICIRKKSSYISISTKNPELYPDMKLRQNKTEAKSGFYRCDIASPEEIAKYSHHLCQILENAIYSQPKECDICDLYRECSNAKKCVHPKREFALHCGYKRILRSGRIFYGVNRNVD